MNVIESVVVLAPITPDTITLSVEEAQLLTRIVGKMCWYDGTPIGGFAHDLYNFLSKNYEGPHNDYEPCEIGRFGTVTWHKRT